MLRLFIESPLHAGATLTPSPAQTHYLSHVMRRTVGDQLLLFNGEDGEWQAEITALKRDRASLAVTHQTQPQTAEKTDLWCVFAPLKRDAIDLLVQKATELGVTALRPVFTARTNAGRVNLDRLRAIAIEAAEQSERLSVPALHPPVPLLTLLAGWPPERILAAAIERGQPAPVPHDAGALLVGPEGGFDRAELDALRASRFMVPICLGPRILRAETAVIAGLALLQGGAWSTR